MIQNKPYIVGLTGSVASGKSSLARALRAAGARVIDTDQIGRALAKPGGPAIAKIRACFGDAVFSEDRLDRKTLGDIVFSDQTALKALNAIMHPMITTEVLRQLSHLQRHPVVIIDAPLLFESGMDCLCDEVWCARATTRQQVARMRRRDCLSLHQALKRIRSQMPAHKKARLSDCTINTGASLRQSERRIHALWCGALRKASYD